MNFVSDFIVPRIGDVGQALHKGLCIYTLHSYLFASTSRASHP